MKKLFVIITFLFSIHGFGQNSYRWISNVDFFIHRADSLSNKSQITFHLNKMLKNGRSYRETWHYTINEGRVIIFQIRYSLDSTEFTEIYYLNRGKLICSEEYETIYFSSYEDEIKWGAICYFEDYMLKQFVSMGHRKPVNITRAREKDTISRFAERFSELQQNMILPSIERIPTHQP